MLRKRNYQNSPQFGEVEAKDHFVSDSKLETELVSIIEETENSDYEFIDRIGVALMETKNLKSENSSRKNAIDITDFDWDNEACIWNEKLPTKMYVALSEEEELTEVATLYQESKSSRNNYFSISDAIRGIIRFRYNLKFLVNNSKG